MATKTFNWEMLETLRNGEDWRVDLKTLIHHYCCRYSVTWDGAIKLLRKELLEMRDPNDR